MLYVAPTKMVVLDLEMRSRALAGLCNNLAVLNVYFHGHKMSEIRTSDPMCSKGTCSFSRFGECFLLFYFQCSKGFPLPHTSCLRPKRRENGPVSISL